MLFPTTARPLIGAHRGASAQAPENTMAAFDLAVEQGAELIELDVHRSLDGGLVIIHDFDVARTTGRPGLVAELTAAQLRDLDAGSWKGEQWAGARIPTLDQVLDRYGSTVLLNIEIKAGNDPSHGIAGQVAQAVRRRNLYDRVVISSFDWAIIKELRRVDPAVRVALLADRRPDEALLYAAELGAVGVHLKAELVTTARAARAQTHGLGILAWTVDEPEEMARLAALGIDAIVSNVPSRLREVVLAHR
ncbi:MAG TPA: glycerophosphodiester phosphodiesterase family protein [Chloroflexota bacterium]|nr:glycerophosphodiester phosphodiesterase family protein [Chloroflexota bacterium]